MPLGFQWLPNVNAPLKAGGAKPLAVAAKTRLAALPDVPTIVEAGLPDYIASGWFALMAPRGTPKDIVAKLNSELRRRSTIRRCARASRRSAPSRSRSRRTKPPSSSRSETAKWRDIITKAGVPQIQ